MKSCNLKVFLLCSSIGLTAGAALNPEILYDMVNGPSNPVIRSQFISLASLNPFNSGFGDEFTYGLNLLSLATTNAGMYADAAKSTAPAAVSHDFTKGTNAELMGMIERLFEKDKSFLLGQMAFFFSLHVTTESDLERVQTLVQTLDPSVQNLLQQKLQLMDAQYAWAQTSASAAAPRPSYGVLSAAAPLPMPVSYPMTGGSGAGSAGKAVGATYLGACPPPHVPSFAAPVPAYDQNSFGKTPMPYPSVPSGASTLPEPLLAPAPTPVPYFSTPAAAYAPRPLPAYAPVAAVSALAAPQPLPVTPLSESAVMKEINAMARSENIHAFLGRTEMLAWVSTNNNEAVSAIGKITSITAATTPSILGAFSLAKKSDENKGTSFRNTLITELADKTKDDTQGILELCHEISTCAVHSLKS